MPLTHPGTMLAKQFLKPLGITPYRLAKDIKVPLNRITAILAGKRAITPDTPCVWRVTLERRRPFGSISSHTMISKLPVAATSDESLPT